MALAGDLKSSAAVAGIHVYLRRFLIVLKLMTLLQQMAQAEINRREDLRRRTRAQLRQALREFLPGETVLVYGSLTKRGAFSEVSDVDLGIEREPAGMTVYQLISLLGERLGRRTDIVLLPDCRFRGRIVREGETWMPQD